MSEYLNNLNLSDKYSQKMISCEVCSGEEFLLIQKRGRVSKAGSYGELPIYACKNCGFKMQNPRYEDQFYIDYYHQLYREVAFSKLKPDQGDIDNQVIRSSGVLKYINKFISQPGKMLDHGCAAGGTMLPFKDSGWDVKGVDPHKPSVDSGKEFLGLDIRIGSGEELPFDDNSFDLILSLGSTEHVYDFSKMMNEATRVLVRGGYFLIRWRSNHLWGSPLEYYNHNHYRFFTRNTWNIALRRYGFSVVDHTDVEYEGCPGEVYILAKSDLKPSDNIKDILTTYEVDDANKIKQDLINYRIGFAEKCNKFIAFCENLNYSYTDIAEAVRNGIIDYRILLGDDEWAVKRALTEAKQYITNYNEGLVV